MVPKIVAGVLVLILVAVLAFKQVNTQPLDARATLQSGIDQVKKQKPDLSQEQELLLRIQLATADYTTSIGAPPNSIKQLVPKYFDSVPIDVKTGKELEFPLDGSGGSTAPVDGTQVAALTDDALLGVSTEGFINPNTMVIDDFVYDPSGRRDPYQPFDFSGADEVDMTLPPLERYSVGQLKLTAVLSAGTELSAIIEDATGRGYTVRKGARVGNAKGIVVKITEDSVFVVETRTDITGKTTRDTVEMKIHRQQADLQGGSTFNRKIMGK